MHPLNRIAFIGNSLPRRCGIATFTTELQQAVAAQAPGIETLIAAMSDRGHAYDYPDTVALEIRDDHGEDYRAAADSLNRRQVDVVSLQHEFGIFGGEAGAEILTLLSRLTMPVVTTLHTVLANPSTAQRYVIERIAAASARLVVMAEKGRELLVSTYGIAPARIDVIAHGIPDVAFTAPDIAKAQLGFAGKSVILTFGLLSPNKGIEVMIDAMPGILARCPDTVYVVLGATHPNLVRDHGEAYREALIARAVALGLGDSVLFRDQFFDQPTLLGYISMCDVYVTPYLNEGQMTSGTLAYSFGLGKAVVSTPYWHARELLADGQGLLVPFGDPLATGEAVASLLENGPSRTAMRERAYAASRSMTWPNTAARYLDLFEAVRHEPRLRLFTPRPRDMALPALPARAPDLRFNHLNAMCDDTGILQHAVHCVADRAHGYCIDDNARGLLLAATLAGAGEPGLPDVMISRFAAFVQHAWNPDRRRFRNFMGFGRTWLEEQGSEDSHGRALWALGHCARRDPSPTRRRWASALFAQAMGAVEGFTSPRAFAFTLLGLEGYAAAAGEDHAAPRLKALLHDRLAACLMASEGPDWVWFEAGLAYDNARLPQAMLLSDNPAHVALGLRALRWLMTRQTAPTGQFRPVGSANFGLIHEIPHAYDQQPLEAAATISACLAAARADGDPAWKREATRAFAWFLGDNELSVPLADIDTGACRDGLHPDRANENRGAESVLSYLLALTEIRQMGRLARQIPASVTSAAQSA